jgi:hypothetical protein
MPLRFEVILEILIIVTEYLNSVAVKHPLAYVLLATGFKIYLLVIKLAKE